MMIFEVVVKIEFLRFFRFFALLVKIGSKRVESLRAADVESIMDLFFRFLMVFGV